ncbi:MAG: hypothetical protein WBQ94_17750, partial [Terracidiphilus sp.]
VKAYLVRTQPVATNAYAKAAIAVGIQLAAAVQVASAWGVTAAQSEFATTQAAESQVASQLKTLPPIS